MAKSKKKNVVSPTLSKKKKNSDKLKNNIKKKKNYFWLIASLVLFILSLITFGLYLWCPFPSIFVVDDIYVSDDNNLHLNFFVLSQKKNDVYCMFNTICK